MLDAYEAHERTLYTDIIVGYMEDTNLRMLGWRRERGGGGGGVVCDLEHMQPLGSGW